MKDFLRFFGIATVVAVVNLGLFEIMVHIVRHMVK